ncbi:MAG TPA: cell division protein ZipA C-terminal FtsZ-binding domain-containing protein [Burkholderiales bacterium]|nr:cell division protein ZipA C-terminal FtsZ-binding domain-containing protein [Burkholderiales bacterium]
MSDLQIGLLLLGLCVVAGVVAYNWWQERQFRKRGERAFPRPESDVLLAGGAEPVAGVRPGSHAPRIEPQFVSAPLAAGPAGQQTESAMSLAAGDETPDPKIDYVAEVRAGEVIPAAAISALRQALAPSGKRIVLAGYDYHSRTWQPVADGNQWFTSLRVGMQLVDRSGPVARGQLESMATTVKDHARSISAIAELPEIEPALAAAGELNEFCSNVDVIVGINVIAHTGQVFHGAQIRALADAAKMTLLPSGVFVLRDETGDPLFTLDNQESKPFKPEHIRHITTPGITFLLDVPRTAAGMDAFDRMVAMGRYFAESLDGLLADDNRVLLNDAGLDKIRLQLRSIYAAMDARGLPAGSPASHRLFS